MREKSKLRDDSSLDSAWQVDIDLLGFGVGGHR